MPILRRFFSRYSRLIAGLVAFFSKRNFYFVQKWHGTVVIPSCSKAIIVERRPKFWSIHRHWWRLHMSELFLNGAIITILRKSIKTSTCIYEWFFTLFTWFAIFPKRYVVSVRFGDVLRLLILNHVWLRLRFCVAREVPRCTVTPECWDFMTSKGTSQYAITHQLLYFIVIEHVSTKRGTLKGSKIDWLIGVLHFGNILII